MHERLLYEYARQYTNSYLPIEDLKQEGFFGLMDAMERFNPAHGTKFSTYASYWIRRSILRFVYTHTHMVYLPIYLSNIAFKVSKYSVEYEEKNIKTPFYIFLSKKLDVSEEKARAILRHLQTTAVLSLDFEHEPNNEINSYNRNGAQFVAAIPSKEDICRDVVERIDISNFMKAVKKALTEKEWDTINRHYGIESGVPMSYTECGAVYGLSREGARQIEKRAFEKLRRLPSVKKFKSCVAEA